MGALHANEFTEQLYRLVPKSFYIRHNQVHYSDDKTEVEYNIRDRKTHTILATFRARPLPGCCGVLVVYYLRPAKNAPAPFKRVSSLVVAAAGRAKYGAVLMSQVVGSLGDKALGGLNCAEFVNHKTKNSVRLSVQITLAPKEPKAPKFVEDSE